MPLSRSASTPSTCKTRFLIISDTHGIDFFGDDDGQRDAIWKLESMPKADVVLHCGDLTNMGSIPDHAAALTMLSRFDAELKLVIAGNHDLSLDAQASLKSPEMRQIHQKAVKMWTGKKAKAAGIIYLTEGLKTFRLNSGASFTIHASPYTPEFNNWAFGYNHDLDRFGAASQCPISAFPDIVMTHGPPFGHLDSANATNLGCKHLRRAIEYAQPRLHCFGHIHESAGASLVDWVKPINKNITLWEQERLRSTMVRENPSDNACIDVSKTSQYACGSGNGRTLMLNAAMVDHKNKPRFSSPWIVEMNLHL